VVSLASKKAIRQGNAWRTPASKISLRRSSGLQLLKKYKRERYPKAVTLSKGRRTAMNCVKDETNEPLMRDELK
jgi:hypothetical protein